MLFIIIEHINGEISDILPKYIIDREIAKEYALNGYFILQVDLKKNLVSEFVL